MKTLLQKCFVFYLGYVILSLLLPSCNSGSEKEDSKTGTADSLIVLIKPAKPQDSIDFALHVVDSADGYHQMNEAHDKIRVGCNSPDSISKVVEIIELAHFDSLLNCAKRINPGLDSNRINALRFIYGLGEDKRMKLIFQPLVLKRTSSNSTRLNATYDVDSSVYYFMYDHKDGFYVITKDSMDELAKRYSDNITFVTGHKKGHIVCRNFIHSNDSIGDVKRIIYSFDEITTLLTDHKSNELYILSSAKMFQVNGVNVLKHLMLLGSHNFHFIDKGLFFRKFGNLSHLCPPSCNTVQYNLKKP